MKLSEIIQKNLTAKFEFYRDKKLYYSIVKDQKKYRFPISIDDSGSGYFNPEMKSVELMRWIRKAIENEDLYIEDVKL